MIKGIAHDYGFGVSVEAACRHSDGAIDVLIEGEQKSFAVEISVTTSPEHELENLKKCFAEHVDEVWCVAPDQVHRLEIQNLVLERLPQSQSARMRYFAPNMISDYIKQFDERETTLIRGYEVVVRTAPSSPEDVEYREMRIRQVLDR